MSTHAKEIAIQQTLKAQYLSHFTPSMMSPETLEAMFVKREPLLQRCVEDVATSVLFDTKLHHLLIGSRGIGKTHLISLLHHRLANRDDVIQRSLIAWMREEEWGVTSFFEFVLRLLRTLDKTYPELAMNAAIDELYTMSAAQAESAASHLLLETLGDKTLVIFVENIDDLFDQIGDTGQKQLRAFIQNHQKFSIVATAPSLFRGISLQSSAFYGFFQLDSLEQLSFEDVLQLLEKIALQRGDDGLAKYIHSPEGRARVRAVHHLAEGNPRIYIIFAQFLTQESLDELVQAFMHTLDELTPYYQARMKELPGQQRKILEFLIQYRGAARVKEIAKHCFITHQVCSSQLKQLRDKSYVVSKEIGRDSFYELAEPLMRICMEVKQQQGQPISLFVELLRIWYSEPQLKEFLRSDSSTTLQSEYIQRAIEAGKSGNTDPKVQAVEAAFDDSLKCANWRDGVKIIDELTALGTDSAARETLLLICLLLQNNHPLAEDRHAFMRLATAFCDRLSASNPPNVSAPYLKQLSLGILFASMQLYGDIELRPRIALCVPAILNLLAANTGRGAADIFAVVNYASRPDSAVGFAKAFEWLKAILTNAEEFPALYQKQTRLATALLPLFSLAQKAHVHPLAEADLLVLPREQRKLLGRMFTRKLTAAA